MAMHSGTESAGEARRCSLVRPIRDREGRLRFHENPAIVREVVNLGRLMYLVRFDDGATTFVFPDEIRW
jgi:hypothetical protein